MNRPAPAARWTTLVISLPGRRGTTRMRVWRALKGVGAAVLRDGVYLLPDSAGARVALEDQARAIHAAGGTAHVLPLEPVTGEQDAGFRALFDRSAEYGAMIARLQKLRDALGRRSTAPSGASLRAARRDAEALRVTDYFPGAAARQAAELLAEIEALAASRESPGEPGGVAGPIVARDPKAYRGRRWVTRARPWVDRLASAWLIRRRIDPRARFIWLKNPARRPKHALGFDFDGAEFTHVGSRVTFEVLAASFGLETDPVLRRLGAIVHCLDVGGAPVLEAPGLAAVLAGARERLRSDDALLAEACRIFDHLYASFSVSPKE